MRIFPCSSTRRAFTLLELLVVISIIAVLAGILLPVGSGVLDRAKKTDAKVTLNNVITAVKAYQTDYGQYPVVPSATGEAQDVSFDTGEAAAGKGGRNGKLFDVLRALNSAATATDGDKDYKALNSRRISYFESKDVKNPADPRGGFIPTGAAATKVKEGFAAGDLVDPFGNLFCFRVDSNYTDLVMQPYPMTGKAPGGVSYTGDKTDDPAKPPTDSDKFLRTSVIGWSAGKDLKFGDDAGKLTSAVDDVVSWQ